MKIIELSGTTSASSSAVSISSDEFVIGFVEKVVYEYDNASASASIILTCEDVVSENLLTKANLGTASAIYYPRAKPNKLSDGSAFTDAATKAFIVGKLKASVTEAGTAASIRLLTYISDE